MGPPTQRVPSADRLRKWYHDMIRRGVRSNIIVSSTSLFEEHYEAYNKPPAASKKKKKSSSSKNKKGKVKKDTNNNNNNNDLPLPDFSMIESENNTPTPGAAMELDGFIEFGNGLRVGGDRMTMEDLQRRRLVKAAKNLLLPYFAGDYWPQEAEELVKTMVKNLKLEKAGIKTDGRRSRKRLRDDEEAKLKTLEGEKFFVDSNKLFSRIGDQLEAMRDDFLVVKFAHECTKCGEYLLRGRWECRHEQCINRRGFNESCPYALCQKCFDQEV